MTELALERSKRMLDLGAHANLQASELIDQLQQVPGLVQRTALVSIRHTADGCARSMRDYRPVEPRTTTAPALGAATLTQTDCAIRSIVAIVIEPSVARVV